MNTYNPPLTLKQRLQHLRYAKLERQLKPLCKWVDFYDYLWSYGSIDWKDKVVLDIGADIGSSALFFLMNGAKYVYIIERDIYYKNEYEFLKPVHHLLNSTIMLASIANMPDRVDVLKMDCEGCELNLLTEDLLKKSNEFVVGLHKPQLDDYQFEQKRRLLEKYGGKYYGSVNGGEFVWLKRK